MKNNNNNNNNNNNKINENERLIYENIYFKMSLKGNDFTEVHLESKSKEIQEQYDSNEVMSNDEKLKQIDELLDYFYNFWKIVESNNGNKLLESNNGNNVNILYTLHININLIMINVPPSYYLKIKGVLDSLKSVVISNLKESFITIESKLAKYFFDLILTFYTPIKPISIIYKENN